MIELTLLVHEKGPARAHRFGVGLGKVTGLEGHENDLNARLAEALFRLLHLHEVPSAWQSPEMAVEHHQDPGAAVVLEATNSPVSIGQRKRHGGLANETVHDYFFNPAVQFCTIVIGDVTASSAATFIRNRPSAATAYCARA